MANAPRVPTRDDIIDDFVTAAWQDEVEQIDTLVSKHPWLLDPAETYLLRALHTACNSCQANSAQQLVEKYHADVNRISADGTNALHEALNSHDIITAKMLIRNGADINIPTQTTDGFVDGWTPLHFAVSHRDTDMIMFLLSKGANAQVKDNDGLNAADFARRDRRDDLAVLIEKFIEAAAQPGMAAPKPPKPGM